MNCPCCRHSFIHAICSLFAIKEFFLAIKKIGNVMQTIFLNKNRRKTRNTDNNDSTKHLKWQNSSPWMSLISKLRDVFRVTSRKCKFFSLLIFMSMCLLFIFLLLLYFLIDLFGFWVLIDLNGIPSIRSSDWTFTLNIRRSVDDYNLQFDT